MFVRRHVRDCVTVRLGSRVAAPRRVGRCKWLLLLPVTFSPPRTRINIVDAGVGEIKHTHTRLFLRRRRVCGKLEGTLCGECVFVAQ